jgi:2-hydroxychromene-2-carboxylate isomerase
MRIGFYFDYACPWAYIANCRVEAYFGALGAEIEFLPIVLADAKEPTAGKGAKSGERKLRYYGADLRRWAELVGAEFSQEGPAKRPDTRLLLRAALVAQDVGRFREFHYPAFRARWAEARCVDDPSVVRELLEEAGLKGREALERASSDTTDQRLEEQTRLAVDRGVFGVPTLLIEDQIFWGNDRFELAAYYVRKLVAE